VLLVDWERPVRNGGLSSPGYEVETRVGRSGDWVPRGVALDSWVRLEFPDDAGAPVSVRVRSVNRIGESRWMTRSTRLVDRRPGAAVRLTAQPRPDSLRVEWSDPRNGGVVEGWRVEYRRVGSSTWEVPNPDLVVDYSMIGLDRHAPGRERGVSIFGDFEDRARYQVRVAAIGVEGQLGRWITRSVTYRTPGAPSAVRNLRAWAGPGVATLTWREPNDVGGNRTLYYRVQYRNADGEWVGPDWWTDIREWETRNGTIYSATFSQLEPGKSYVFRVFAQGAEAGPPVFRTVRTRPLS